LPIPKLLSLADAPGRLRQDGVLPPRQSDDLCSAVLDGQLAS
jgi:hypothetical protein